MKALWLAGVLVLGCAWGWGQDPFTPPVAIVDVTAVPVPGQEIADATIVIDKGRIVRVGVGIEVPPGAAVFDGAGLYAYAGFIDAATHLGIADKKPSDEVLNRVTDDEYPMTEGPRTHMQQANRLGVWPHLGAIDFYKHDPKAVEPYRQAGFTTALITPQPDVVSGAGDLVQLTGKPLRGSTLAPRVTQIMGFGDLSGVDYRVGRAYPTSPMGAVAMIRQLYLDAEWYRARHEQFERQPAKFARVPNDPVLEAVGVLLDHQQTWIFAADTPDEIHHAIDLSKELDQRMAILGGKEAWKVADRLRDENVPVIVSVDFGEKPLLSPKVPEKEVTYPTQTWSPAFEEEFFEPPKVRKDRVRIWEAEVNNLHALITAGVRVALTTRDLKGPDKLQENLAKALELELTPDELLGALTQSAATILGVDSQLGSIEAGKIANLTLLTHPLGHEDSRVQHVFIDGERFGMTIEREKKKDGEDETEDAGEVDAADAHPWSAELPADREIAIDTGGDVLLKNARVLDVIQGTHQIADVLVRGGTIRKIAAGIAAPRDVTEIDLSGYWLLPGIVDPHSHIALAGINEFAESISCEVRQSDVVNHTAQSIHRALAGGVTTVHAMHGSANTIGGQNAVLKLKYNTSPSEMLVTTGPRIVKFALGENVTRARPIPRFPNSRMGVESVLRHAFTAGLKYQEEWRTYRAHGGEIPRRDLRLEALGEILDCEIWVHSHCYRGDEIVRLLDVAAEFGIRVATLQHVLEGYRVMPEIYGHGAGASTFSDWWSYKKEAFDAIPQNAAMLVKAGIVTSLNSDDPEMMRHLNFEAGKTLRFGGLTAAEALKLITINPAIQLGLSDRIGSINEGKDGDFAVFTGHPLDSHARNVMTLIEGEIAFMYPGVAIDGSTPGPDSDFVPEPPRGLLPGPQAASTYAIVGATIHPVTSAPIENGMLLIADGKITSVGPAGQLPNGTAVVDAAGLHVYPGIINAASEMGLAEIEGIPQTVDHADLARFAPELQAFSGINPHSEHIPVSLCEGITLSHVLPSGGIISGRASVIQMSGWSTREMLRSGETGLVIELPILPAKTAPEFVDPPAPPVPPVPPSLPAQGPEVDPYEARLKEHQKTFEAIEAFMRDAQHYASMRADDPQSPINVRLEAMLPYSRGEAPVFFRAQSYKAILQALKFAEAFRLKPVILGGGDAWKLAAALAEKQIPVIVDSVTLLPLGEDPLAASPLLDSGDTYERFNAYYENPMKLHEAGVLFAIASNGTQHAKKTAVYAGLAIAHGLPLQSAIESVTINAAKILGLEESVGSLEPGKIADVIITTGDPTQTSTRTVACFVAGQPVTLDSLHERSYRKFGERPAPVLEAAGDLAGPEPMRTR